MYYMAGYCAFGSQCRYAHVRPDGTTLAAESQATPAPSDGGQHAASDSSAAHATQGAQNGQQGVRAAPEQDVRGMLPPGCADAAWEDEAPCSSPSSQPSNSTAARGQDSGATAHSSQAFKASPSLRTGQPVAPLRPLRRQSPPCQEQVNSGRSTGTQQQDHDQLTPVQFLLREVREISAQLSSAAPAAARSRDSGQHGMGMARGAQAEQQSARPNAQQQDCGSAAGSRSYEPAEQTAFGELAREMKPGRESLRSLSNGAWLAAGDSHDEDGSSHHQSPAGITRPSANDEDQGAEEDGGNGAGMTYRMWQHLNSLQDGAGPSYKEWLAAEADDEDDGTAYEEWLVANDFPDDQEGWVEHCMEAVLGHGQYGQHGQSGLDQGYGNGFHHSYDCDSYQSEAGFVDGAEEDYQRWQVGISASSTPAKAPDVLPLEAHAQMTYMSRQFCGLNIVLVPSLSSILTVQEDAAKDVYHHGDGSSQQPQGQDRAPVNGSATEQRMADSGSRGQANHTDGSRWTCLVVKRLVCLGHHQ